MQQAHFLLVDNRALPLLESYRRGVTLHIIYVPGKTSLWLGSVLETQTEPLKGQQHIIFFFSALLED